MSVLSLILIFFAGMPSTVPSLDLHRYMGRWYEVARLPNRFQNHCVGDVIVDYSLRPDGKMALANQCRQADGKTDVSHAVGHLARPGGPPSQLKVVFFWPLQADYWVIDLDPDYRWAVVADPDRTKLWVLSRTPSIDPPTYQDILKRAGAQGYDVRKIEVTKQSGAVVH
jgi:apolipoprotein D and lipocalin family protein